MLSVGHSPLIRFGAEPGPPFRVRSWENGNGIKSRRQRPARRWKASSERGRYGASSAWSEGRSGQAGHRQNDATARKEYAKISGSWAYVLARVGREKSVRGSRRCPD